MAKPRTNPDVGFHAGRDWFLRREPNGGVRISQYGPGGKLLAETIIDGPTWQTAVAHLDAVGQASVEAAKAGEEPDTSAAAEVEAFAETERKRKGGSK